MRRCLVMVSPLNLVNYPSINVYARFMNKYGVGPEDFGGCPYVRPCPFAATPLPHENYRKTGFLRKLFGLTRK